MSEAENQQLNTEATLGKQLRINREAKGLSIEDVAHHLKIDRTLLQDFEEEREPSHNLPEVYCKGFLRNYARFLGVEIQPGQIKACRTADVRLSGEQEVFAPKHSLLPYLLIVVVVAVALLFVTGNLNHETPAPAVEEEEQQAVQKEATSSAVAVEAIEKATPEAEPAATGAEEATALATTPVAETAEAIQAPKPAVQQTAIANENAAESTEAAPAVTETTTETESAAAATRGTVTIRYIDRSFTQVTDGLGRVIVKRMLDAGAVEDFEGPLPLEVNLGNAIGVRVQFNGELFDHLNFIDDNNIAQFVLGAAE